jgi:hypothetical protein
MNNLFTKINKTLKGSKAEHLKGYKTKKRLPYYFSKHFFVNKENEAFLF